MTLRKLQPALFFNVQLRVIHIYFSLDACSGYTCGSFKWWPRSECMYNTQGWVHLARPPRFVIRNIFSNINKTAQVGCFSPRMSSVTTTFSAQYQQKEAAWEMTPSPIIVAKHKKKKKRAGKMPSPFCFFSTPSTKNSTGDDDLTDFLAKQSETEEERFSH